MLKIINYPDGDWVTVVKDGKTIFGNHSVSAEEILKLLDIEFESEYFEGDEDEWYDYVKQFGGESA
jgi:hypothetical protein